MSNHSFATVAATPALGFYLRNNLADTGSGAQVAPYGQSPDIIQSDTLVHDPQATFATRQSWGQAYNTAPVVDINYYYARGRNGGTASAAPQVSLYAAPAQLIAWPSLWGKPLPTVDGQTVSVLSSVHQGAIGVTPKPFAWIPAPLPATSSFHAFVAWSTSRTHPAPPPQASSFTEMAALMTVTPGLALNQVTCLDADAGPWVVRMGLSIPATVNDAQPIVFLLSASGLNGAAVGVLSDTFTAGRQLLQLAPQVPPDGTVIGFTANLQPGYQGSLVVQIWPGTSPPLNGATLTLQAQYQVPQDQIAQAAWRGTLSAAGRHLRALGITPQAMSPLGEVTITFSRG